MSTSRCDRLCSTCLMYDWVLTDRPAHDISLEQLDRFLRASESSGYKFYMHIGGGEPLLWPNLYDGLRMIKESRCSAGILLPTNGKMSPKKAKTLEECLPFFDCLRITRYHDNESDAEEILNYVRNRSNMPIKISGRTTHYLGIPSRRVENGTPAICRCSAYAFWGEEVTLCVSAPILMRKLPEVAHVDYSKKYIWNSDITQGYLKKFKTPRTEQIICGYCVQNKRVASKRKTACPVATGENT